MTNKNVYLVAFYSCKPKNKSVKTTVKGWMDNPDNVAWDEQINITVNLKKKDLAESKVILNLKDRSVYRNSWKSDKGFEELFQHYYNGYQKYLDTVIQELGYEMVSETNVVNSTTITNADQVTDVLPKNETISSE